MKYTKFELARIVGARALQLAMGAPLLIKTDEKDTVKISEDEFNRGVLPITIKRPSPFRK